MFIDMKSQMAADLDFTEMELSVILCRMNIYTQIVKKNIYTDAILYNLYLIIFLNKMSMLITVYYKHTIFRNKKL